MIKKAAIVALGLLCLLYSTHTSSAYAYLDPGTGSYIFQILIAALIGGAFAVKIFWGKITTFIKNLFASDKADKDKEKNLDSIKASHNVSKEETIPGEE